MNLNTSAEESITEDNRDGIIKIGEETQERTAYRIIDANLNRLREGLRCVEEYFRLSWDEKESKAASRIRSIRRLVKNGEMYFSEKSLLECRETESDPFSAPDPSIDSQRDGLVDVVKAGIKRSQEASRAIEEYSLLLKNVPDPKETKKYSSKESPSSIFKKIRFMIYELEKDVLL